ncbi:homeobox-DDT domain protein RLT1-like [Olea europaea var. sylvestris]|nr:homeobox-DDT domain protein RLT1-like [Olea europaea var. sylvestris]
MPQLPWIPQTTAAVALRLLELDASIFYVSQQKAELHDEKSVEALPKITFRYSYSKDIPKTETTELDQHGPVKERNWGQLRDIPGSSGSRQVVRKRGSGRPRGRSRKRVFSSISKSSRQGIRQGETLTQVLMQHGARTGGQRHGRGRRTLRKRRTEKVVLETLPNYLGDTATLESIVEEPRNSVHEELVNFDARNIEIENDASSNSMEAGDFDDNALVNPFEFEKWGSSYDVVPNRSKEMVEMSDEDVDEVEHNGYEEEEEGEKFEGLEMNDNSDGERDGNMDEGSDSIVSGDYSD